MINIPYIKHRLKKSSHKSNSIYVGKDQGEIYIDLIIVYSNSQADYEAH